MALIDDARADPRPVGELVETALIEQEGGSAPITGALMALQVRGTIEVLDAARQLSRSSDARRRSLACYILRELGSPEPTFPEACCDALLDMLAREKDIEVLSDVLYGFGYLRNRRADPHVAALRSHADARIRRGVAFSLVGASSAEAVEALLDLMEDSDDLVRDWATNSIAEQPQIDGPKIREALWRRASDRSLLVRCEALTGLAWRGDRRVVPRLINELRTATGEQATFFHNAANSILGLPEDEVLSSTGIVLKRLRQSLVAR